MIYIYIYICFRYDKYDKIQNNPKPNYVLQISILHIFLASYTYAYYVSMYIVHTKKKYERCL